jgi:hypothetical protein
LDIEDFGKKPPKNYVFWKASYNKARNLRRRFLPKAKLALKAEGFVWEEEPIFWKSSKKGKERERQEIVENLIKGMKEEKRKLKII